MTEVRLSSPVAAVAMEREAFHRDNIPGAFYVGETDSDGEMTLWYCCPCGCGSKKPLTVGNGFKPADGRSWRWNGSREKPTLEPSVHHVGHWHGWLRDGKWVQA